MSNLRNLFVAIILGCTASAQAEDCKLIYGGMTETQKRIHLCAKNDQLVYTYGDLQYPEIMTVFPASEIMKKQIKDPEYGKAVQLIIPIYDTRDVLTLSSVGSRILIEDVEIIEVLKIDKATEEDYTELLPFN